MPPRMVAWQPERLRYRGLIARRDQLGDDGSGALDGIRQRPVAALDDGRGFVGLAFGEAALFAARGPIQEGANHPSDHTAEQAELAPDFLAHDANLLRHRGLGAAEVVLHGP